MNAIEGVLMGCVFVLVLLGMPRFGLLWLWLAHTGYVRIAMGGSNIFPLLGFLFLPTTTLAFAFGFNDLGGGTAMTPFGWLLVAIGLVIDLGVHSVTGRSGQRRWQRAPRR